MHTTATLHVHPACTTNRHLIHQLQTQTGCVIIIHGGKPRLVPQPQTQRPTPFDPNGGHAA